MCPKGSQHPKIWTPVLKLVCIMLFSWTNHPSPPQVNVDITSAFAVSGQVLSLNNTKRLVLPEHLHSVYERVDYLRDSDMSTFVNTVSNFETELLDSWCGLASMSTVLNTISKTFPLTEQHSPYPRFSQNTLLTIPCASRVKTYETMVFRVQRVKSCAARLHHRSVERD
jgi:hypothetical protein